MIDSLFDKDYWESRYAVQKTGWDVGYISTPLKKYFDQLGNKDLRILIPGAGNGHEAIYLFESGFSNVHVLDISPLAIAHFQANCPHFPFTQVHLQDFWEHYGEYDLIVEQTFFCAIVPKLRTDYCSKVAELLVPRGKIVGLLWGVPMNEQHPPFGGDAAEYQKLFESTFEISTMEAAYNSIVPRSGRELFINMIKK
ncbi:MAG: thiopurine S-methyltransferase [Marinoscillum sp.]|jgi:thiopurine S-methyltransferase